MLCEISGGGLHGDGHDFSKSSHQQLFDMVQTADPGSVVDVGVRLLAAAQKMQDISDELHAHMSSLEWKGQAADSFKSWGNQVSTATMQLGEYSTTAGTYMQQAGYALSDVRAAMPPVPNDDMNLVSRYQSQPNIEAKIAGGILGGLALPGFGSVLGAAEADRAIHAVDSSWVTQDMANAANKRVADAHNEAIQQMTKLGQSYDQSITQLNQAQPPTFPAPPGSSRGGETGVPVGIGGTGSRGGGGNSGGGGGFHPPRWSPPKETGPVTPPPGYHPGPTPNPPGPGPVSPPPTLTPPPSTGIDSVPTLPTPGTPPVTSPSTGLPGGGGLGGTGGGGIGAGSAGFVPSNFTGVAGGGVGGSGSRGAGNAGGAGGAAGAGGRAGTAATGGAGQAGKPGASAMPHAGGMGGAGGAKGGGARGSGLTSRAGGTVGGRRGPAAGGAFTEGGTGLRGRAERGKDGRAGQGGMAGGHGAAGKKEREKRNRADYLYEDEDTWTSGTGPVNPGVIE